jgi:hypothetical protein
MGKGSGLRTRLGALVAVVVASAMLTAEGVTPVSAIDPLPSVLLSVAVTPTGATVAPGGHQQFNAIGTYSDLTTRDITAQVNWTTSDAAIATVSNSGSTKGRATGVAAGGASITATDPSSTLSGVALLAVAPLPPPPPPTLVAVVVTPAAAQVLAGTVQQFTATGTYSDLSTDDITASVTWTSSDPAVATVSNAAGTKGRATGVAEGAATITATATGGTAGSGVLTVTPIVVVPPIIPPTTPPPSQPTKRELKITPATGEPWTEVTIQGVLFPASRRIRVQYETGLAKPRRVRLCKTVTSSKGAFTCYARIPGDQLAGRAGKHPVVAKILRRPKVAPVTGTFTVQR